MKMHNNEKWFEPELWQRVVDGELSSVELRELVGACEEHPALWKRCAVAFLEEQTLELELKELNAQWPATVTEALDRALALSTRSDHSRLDATRCAEMARGQADTSATIRRARPLAAVPSHWLNHLGFAASIMLAFFIGWQAAQRFGGDRAEHAASHASEIRSGDNHSIDQAGSASAFAVAQIGGTGGAPTDDSAPAQSAFVGMDPSVEVAADAIQQALQRAEQFVPLDRRIPQQLVDLEQRGLVRIESIEGFVPVRLRDGNTAVVPVQQIELRPIRNAY